MKTAVDTNVLLDLLTTDADSESPALDALADALSAGPVVICPVVYAELASSFANPEGVATFLHDLEIGHESLSAEALFEASVAWRRYLARRGKQVECSQCGQKTAIRCPACGAPLAWRQHIIADFIVGGHASQQADCLLTRDAGYYRTYFPNLRLTSPVSK